ncbi:MAG: DNA polymerase III subunit epsilon [Devosia sp.]|uniref:DNA polymerase III subunit epsilon n=1 Tax=Devosia sp. TaxID=1871048 RepID=UPI001AC1E901|nr:DNA polymerase III subunit epsilon [Devosia sp.]MBN9309481.1 DNA polymerase III subunit epsilon [Devosia sp.]MBN9315950.1 DNA polymerase III subunit epsilon [Devosia sp.]
MTREIVLDTETTGLSPTSGDRVVEIGCVELLNHIPTGRHFHVYLNPERDVPDEAFRVHGLSTEFLRDKPLFAAEADNFLEFIADATLVIHNADFDMGFLNFELERLGRSRLSNPVIDTVMVARERHPGARVSLDALCKHYGIDNSRRVLHGALLDSEILADVYLELIGGRQVALSLSSDQRIEMGRSAVFAPARQRPVPLAPRLSDAELKAHAVLVGTLGADALWVTYSEVSVAAE